jgi:hypothetical protein
LSSNQERPLVEMKPRKVNAYSGASGDDAHEPLVQFALVVKDRLADLIHRPHPLWVIGVIDEAAREHLIAVPRRIKEVDRLTTGDAMPGRADIERDVIARDDVRGLADPRATSLARKRRGGIWLARLDE